jgi:hypothetical protein
MHHEARATRAFFIPRQKPGRFTGCEMLRRSLSAAFPSYYLKIRQLKSGSKRPSFWVSNARLVRAESWEHRRGGSATVVFSSGAECDVDMCNADGE